jgi:cardiolipin-specific phospholipase
MKGDATPDEIIKKTEDFFVDSLEEWRKKMEIDSMVLMGHSLGGYLSTAYCEKYPEKVEKLFLVSPVGLPTAPIPKADAIPKSFLFSIVSALVWSSHITPMSFIRTVGPFGPSLTRRYTSKRFGHLETEELKDFESYFYHICAQSGSGEYALGRLLSPVF